MAALAVAVAGASGRMGRMLVEAVLDSADCRLAGALDVAGSAAVGRDAGAFLGRDSGVRVTDDVVAGIAGADVLIDFTRPAGTLAHLDACGARGVAAVVGTTGFTAQERAAVAAHAQALPIVLAPNMSVGVDALLRIVERAAALLADGWDVEIVEAHHRHKVDAPSGTAFALGEAVARATGTRLDARAVWSREGHTGARAAGAIGFAAVRGGDIVGDHTVLFAGTGERIEITHRSTSRAGYAAGALRAARWLQGRAPGLYGMADVLA